MGSMHRLSAGTSWDRPKFLGILGYSDSGLHAQLVPGTSWDRPINPGILGYSDSGVYKLGHRNVLGLSKYPRIPGILRQSKDVLGTTYARRPTV